MRAALMVVAVLFLSVLMVAVVYRVAFHLVELGWTASEVGTILFVAGLNVGAFCGRRERRGRE